MPILPPTEVHFPFPFASPSPTPSPLLLTRSHRSPGRAVSEGRHNVALVVRLLCENSLCGQCNGFFFLPSSGFLLPPLLWSRSTPLHLPRALLLRRCSFFIHFLSRPGLSLHPALSFYLKTFCMPAGSQTIPFPEFRPFSVYGRSSIRARWSSQWLRLCRNPFPFTFFFKGGFLRPHVGELLILNQSPLISGSVPGVHVFSRF